MVVELALRIAQKISNQKFLIPNKIQMIKNDEPGQGLRYAPCVFYFFFGGVANSAT
jgi:hypothetical protein